MRKLIESTFVTLDGVIGDPQVWGSQYWGDEHDGYVKKLLFSADELLLGRASGSTPCSRAAGSACSTAWSTPPT